MMTTQRPSDTVELFPVRPAERILILDVLRGFALLGILIVDIPGFASPAGLPGYVPPDAMPWYDTLTHRLVALLAEGKFYVIFSFLFGVGVSLQLARAEALGEDARLFYRRRLWVLLGVGILHSIFFWTGDILRVYALLGFALPAFRMRRRLTLLLWAGLFFLLSFFVSSLGHAAGAGANTSISGVDVVSMAKAAYHSSSYSDVVMFQALSSPFSLFITLLTRGPTVMALFLLGLIAGRSKLYERLLKRKVFLRRAFCFGLLVGLAGSSLVFLSRIPWLHGPGSTIAALGLASAYMSGLTMLSLSRTGARILDPLGKVGRMALTNYLLQSLICTLLFDGFGLALYERVDYAGLMVMAILIDVTQVLLSVAWLRQFQFGPVEWLWRSMTYRHLQPFHIKAFAGH